MTNVAICYRNDEGEAVRYDVELDYPALAELISKADRLAENVSDQEDQEEDEDD